MVSTQGNVHAVNVIIMFAMHKLVAIASDTYSSAVDKKPTTAACRDRLVFLMRG